LTRLKGRFDYARRHSAFRPTPVCSAAGLATARRAGGWRLPGNRSCSANLRAGSQLAGAYAPTACGSACAPAGLVVPLLLPQHLDEGYPGSRRLPIGSFRRRLARVQREGIVHDPIPAVADYDSGVLGAVRACCLAVRARLCHTQPVVTFLRHRPASPRCLRRRCWWQDRQRSLWICATADAAAS
jgi:hypothetical protein